MTASLPSIWISEFNSKMEFDFYLHETPQISRVIDWIDDRLLFSRHPFSYPAYCVSCEKVSNIKIDWMFGGWSNTTASIHPAWTETAICETCGLNSRMRALLDFVKRRIEIFTIKRAYIAEETTPMYRKLKKTIPNLIGSEFIAPDIPKGKRVSYGRILNRIRHEDLTDLTFGSNEMDLVITLDVFEHIPNYRKAFSECHRILKSGGHLVFTIPFFFDSESTQIRAYVDEKGTVVNLLPPEIHGNPISKNGSLCFQNFGWDILDELRGIGFINAKACLYWGPWQGHLGFPFFIFNAVKG